MKTRVCETCIQSAFNFDVVIEGESIDEYAERNSLEVVCDSECEWCEEFAREYEGE